MSKVAKGLLAEILEKQFRIIEYAHEEYVIFFTGSNRCNSYIFGSYGSKTNTEAMVRELFKKMEVIFGEMAPDVIRAMITNARDYFRETGAARVKSHFPQLGTQLGHSEDVLMLCTNNFKFDTCKFTCNNVVSNELAKILQDRFELANDMDEEYVIFFTYDNHYESFIFGNYGLKYNTEKKIASLFENVSEMKKRAFITNARDYLRNCEIAKTKSYYPVPQDMDSSSNREDILMICSANFTFDGE